MSDQVIPIKRSPIQIPDFVQAQMAGGPKQAVEEPSKYPTEVIGLPTKGWFYEATNTLSSGQVEIKQMTAREEDLLANQELMKKGIVLDKLLESLLIDKSINISDILIPDKNAIFIAIRRLAYGDAYPVSVTCPQCNTPNKVVINLSQLGYKPFNFDTHPKGENCFSLTTEAGLAVTYKLLCQRDEQAIEAELTQLKKISKEASKELTTRLNYLITSINNNADRAYIRKFISDRLTAKDSLAIRKHMRENNPDVDMSFDFKCNECSLERRMIVPMEASFLWPDSAT